MTFPPRVKTDITKDVNEVRLKTYWRERLEQHTQDSYAGITLSKFPEDLRAYEHLIWDQGPDAILEVGCQFAASTLWFRDRMRTFARYRNRDQKIPKVVAVDIDTASARANLDATDPTWQEEITLLEGDVCDPKLIAQVLESIPAGANTLVIEDSAHNEETTWSALEHFSHLVPPRGYFVVEDGCVDIEALRLMDEWPRGVLPAVDRWLATPMGSRFEQRRDLEFYGVTCHPCGFLQRTR